MLFVLIILDRCYYDLICPILGYFLEKNKKQGLTVFSALRQSDTHVGDWIVIPGAGGGLGHLGMDHNTIE